MSLEAVHPLYAAVLPDWVIMNDTYAGQRAIKAKRTEYLPATAGHEFDGMEYNHRGYKAYENYLIRALFHDFVKTAIETSIGVMHQKPALIELPDKLKPLLESATLEGESLANLLRRMNTEQLKTGRLGLLADLPEKPPVGMLPYISTYKATDIRNWDKGISVDFRVQDANFIVLDESGPKLNTNFDWDLEKRYRVLIINDGEYKVGLFKESNGTLSFSEQNLKAPTFQGKTLKKIPFIFVNAKDVAADPDDVPLLGLANLALAIYRSEADYRLSLFKQGQDTLVLINSNEDPNKEVRVGAGATIHLPIGGDAKYIGVDSKGLPEQKDALENDKLRATHLGGSLIETTNRERESGEALKTRIAAKTVTLTQIALTGAVALESMLMQIADWVGADAKQVKVTPNLDFDTSELEGRTLLDIISSKVLGAPISNKSIHKVLKRGELTDMSYEAEIKEIETEVVLVEQGLDGTGVDDDKPSPGDKDGIKPNSAGAGS